MHMRRFIFLSGRADLSRLLPFVFVAGIFCLSSCEDDLERGKTSTSISFTPVIQSSWGPSARTMTGTDMPQGSVSSLQGGRTSLYLHTLYTDSIALPPSDSRPDRGVLTRATPIKDVNMYESFGVSAYSYTGSWSEDKTPNYFYNATASKSDGGYTLSSTHYWPGSSYKMKFFAYAPTANTQYVLSGRTQAGSPTISVTIPSDVNDQKDLLVAKTDELAGNTNTAVALSFNHALTAIRFVCGDDMQVGTVKSVSLKNVYSKGTYNMGTQTWSDLDTPATFSQTLDKVTTGTPDEALTSEAQTFMMVPQTLPDGAQLEVVFTDNSSIDHTLTADIKGTSWPVGKTVTYKISSSSINWSYTLTVSGPADFTYTGGTQPYSVTSYRENTKGVQEAAPWTAQYSVDNGVSWTDTRPEWLTAFTASGAGGTSAQPYDATVSVQTGTDTSPHTTALQNATAKGTADTPYNLSNQTDGGPTDENTANCYVVSAPGYYSFPLVYGNALKNRSTNESAYKTGNTGSNILSNFINHTGAGISDPYIANNNGCTPAKAELVWQDVMDLVTDIKYNAGSNGGNISFKVDRFSIQQGNAVIAIKDASNNVLWSWHIWVTDENIDNVIEVTNYQNVKYNIMPVNLGWCDDDVTTYAERSCKVRFTAGDASKEVTIRQVSASITIRGNHPYYQWGRKDPLRPSNGLANTNKTWYDKNGTSSQSNPATENFSAGVTCIMNYILKPDVMQNQVSGDNAYANLWSVDNTVYTANDNPVVKTVYDPSPVGFKLPPGNVFTGFTTTGGSTSTSSEINGTWSSSSLKGWNFYTDSSKSKTIFFPASGYRYRSNGMVSNVSSDGFYWSAVPSSPTKGHYLYFSSLQVIPLSTSNYRAVGFGVRSCQE
ncbi:fimbrillin family protein [Bacteroides thetaiotaomicron]|uniref:fimbrillin family protein n=1 Tax=Bacteroides thetaiotaomicron TaxID=818 RepID=UPI002165201F|nr:fimbrillin family protein [Bacteroides thetaiotaomicron]MCS2255269.1 fimbrillin family protein [Bacteroides thetaiotaomicron]UVR59837.1 fimbrillin family protein [Bacteroides fragilis]